MTRTVAETPEPAAAARRWPLAMALLTAATAALFALYWPTATSFYRLWLSSDTYAHGMLIVPIVLLMIWSRRGRLARLTPQPGLAGLLLLLLVCLGWLVAHTADVLIVQQFMFVLMFPALAWTLLGRGVVAGLLFPFAYLFFAVPVGEDMVPPLQRFTALFTVEALQLSGLPVLLEDFFITLPSKNDPLGWDRFHVAEACSGVRYLVASVALGCLYAYFSYRSPWRRLAFIALSALVPIVANGLRAYGIVMLAHHSGMSIAVGVDHLIYGWLFFGVVVLIMFWIGSLWREPAPAGIETGAPPPASSPAAAPLPAMTLAALAVGTGVAFAALQLHNGDAHEAVTLSAPAAAPGWRGPLAGSVGWRPQFHGADATLQARYRPAGTAASDGDVYVYLVYYREERQGAELINSQNRLFDPTRWRRSAAARREVDGIAVNVATIDNRAETQRLYYWYRVAGQDVSRTLQAKLLRAWDQLAGVSKGSALIALGVDVDALLPGEADALLERFMTAMLPALRDALERAADGLPGDT